MGTCLYFSVQNGILGWSGEGRSRLHLLNPGGPLDCFGNTPVIPSGKQHKTPIFNGFFLYPSNTPADLSSPWLHCREGWLGMTCLFIYFSSLFLSSFHSHQGKKDQVFPSLFLSVQKNIFKSYFLGCHLPFPGFNNGSWSIGISKIFYLLHLSNSGDKMWSICSAMYIWEITFLFWFLLNKIEMMF